MSEGVNSRVHKFKVFDKSYPGVFPVCTLHARHDGEIIGGSYRDPAREGYEVDFLLEEGHAELIQFTGLTGKDGVEIYDGDVLFWPEGVNGSTVDWRMLVVWQPGGFWGFADDPEETLRDGDLENAEVLGNIRGNEELMA